MTEPTTRREIPGVYRVLMSDVLFEQMGLDLVTWGEPDAQGFYSPIVHHTYAEREVAEARAALRAELRAAVEGLESEAYSPSDTVARKDILSLIAGDA